MHNQNNKSTPAFEVGDKVWVSKYFIMTKRLPDKPDDEKLGLFVIEQKISENVKRLLLPSTMRNHPALHVSLLELYDDDPSKRLKRLEPRPVGVDGEDEWEVEEVADSCWIKRGRTWKFQYLVL